MNAVNADELWMSFYSLKVISYNVQGINKRLRPRQKQKFPWELQVEFSHHWINRLAMVQIHGPCEKLIVRGRNREALIKFLRDNNLDTHNRRISTIIVHPGGDREEL